MSVSVMIVDDMEPDRILIAAKIEKMFEYDTVLFADGQSAINYLRAPATAENIDLVILDQNMPGKSGLSTLEIINNINENLPVIMLTGTEDTSLAVEAIRRGAFDFVIKSAKDERLLSSVQNAIKVKKVQPSLSPSENTRLFKDLIGHDKGLKSCIEAARQAAAFNIPVIITGETGTGKEEMARAIHGESDRNGKPFIAVNCGAIPENLVESILFGHKKGAFTGAVQDNDGCFQKAHKGTIFLDEIGDLPLESQVKILRVLQQKRVRPVGGTEEIDVDVRILSATNKDLEQLVETGEFREDLYFRLNVMSLRLPALRERKDDILNLAEHFIHEFAKAEGVEKVEISNDAQERLKTYWWPGNVREMQNAINRAMVVCTGHELTPDCLDLLIERRKRGAENSQDGAEKPAKTSAKKIQNIDGELSVNIVDHKGNIRNMDDIEHDVVKLALQKFKGNISRAASALGMSRSTYYRKLKQ